MHATTHRKLTLAAALGALLAGACGEVRPPTAAREAPAATYRDQARAILETRCVRCHSGATPAGSYDLGSYLAALGHGSDDTRNILPGDGESRLLTKLDPVKEPTHNGYLEAADLALLQRWVVQAKAAYQDSSVHPAGWLDTTNRSSTSFHGGFLRNKRWKTTSCRSCHGEALTGGAAEAPLSGGSCYTCHSDGPTGCDTCHGDGKAGRRFADLTGAVARTARGAGAHAAHLKSRASALWVSPTCADCHKVPATVDAEGHLDGDGWAEVTFSDRAAGKLYAGGKGPAAGYDMTTGTCANVHCHGLDGATVKSWKWTSPQTMTCDACHGSPPRKVKAGFDHPRSSDCQACHKTAFDPSRHIDGKVDL